MAMDKAAAGQVTKSAAEIYDEFFVPALFGEWAGRLCDFAEVTTGNDVLDIACGTGAATREVAQFTGPSGRIVGLDRNSGMLSVARKRSPAIEWVEGLAEALPFPPNSFDTILCQFGLMFFDDREKALTEMRRVLRPGGKVALTVWDDVANSPGYAGMVELIETMFGNKPADALRAPFALGNKQTFYSVLRGGGLGDANITTIEGSARFATIREWVRMDVRGWTLADCINDAEFEILVAAAEDRLGQFTADDGSVEFPAPAHIAVWTSKLS